MTELVFHCVICGEQISAARVTRKAVTCSLEHATILKNARRQLRDMSRCRLCNRPTTPAERAAFTAWRKSLNVKRGRKPLTDEEKAARKQARLDNPKIVLEAPPGAALVEEFVTRGMNSQAAVDALLAKPA